MFPHLIVLFPLLRLALGESLSPAAPHIFANPPEQAAYEIPTIHESAVLARRILNLSSIGTLSTVFPASSDASGLVQQGGNLKDHLPNQGYTEDVSAAQPQKFAGSPIGLMEYYATCDPHPFNPTILAVSIATYIRNARSGSDVSLSLRWHPPSSAPPSSDPYLYSPANMPRFSLQGYIEAIPEDEVKRYGIQECFLDRHGEVIWTPGSDIHESWWGRIIVEGIYWFGGFGDRARIGWIPVEEWANVTNEEIEKARLVGEDGYDQKTARRPSSSSRKS
ncbi:MAG: hypothetical protein Q9163_005935 [Psora crenata]